MLTSNTSNKPFFQFNHREPTCSVFAKIRTQE
jgi:hypothetical protein